MPLRDALRRLDDRFINRSRTAVSGADAGGEAPPPARRGDGLPTFLSVVYRVSRLVFLALALVVALAVVLILAPANDDNVIVRNVFDLAETVAGPFKDVFTVADDPEREKVVNYALAAGVYFLASVLVRRLPTFGGKKG